ncbi:unnamed protein product [Paramecium sonneborni]|uniref:Alpha-type protein kinase domain-containing protein n=1 Tax=Paramecium sonneborni TaxID=65129 RepID=A0A8S1R5J0_9CILI|nr:unnamed protein product [Paramecium sonneborni]
MFEKMQKAFPMLTITTKKQPEDLSELVKFTLLESVTKSIQNNQQTNQEYEYQKANFIKFKLDTFTDKYESDYFWKSFLEFCQTRNGETGLKVYKKKLNILDDNSSTYIFKAFDSINNREVIIKIPKKYVDNQKQFTNEEISRDEELAETRFYSSCYACQMAYFFNQRLKENNLLKEMQPLFYAHPILYTLSKPLYGMKKVYGETFIQIQQYKFQKYSNNSKYIDPQKYFYSSFSHFSFEVSKENLVIMDLQGAHNILSDPSIQTEESWISILIKDPTNRFNNGIFDFKTAQHKECSYLCEKLKLHKINQNTKYNQTLCPPNQIKNMYGICYDCDEFISFNEELLNDKNNNKFTFNCKFCSDSMSQKKIDVFCTCCQYMFQTSINNQLKQLTNVGICQDCKNICEKQIVTCYYCRRKCKKIMTDITLNNQTFDICKDAYDYLQAFTCNKCKKSYNQKSIISKEDYEKNTFTCC